MFIDGSEPGATVPSGAVLWGSDPTGPWLGSLPLSPFASRAL